MQAVTKTHPHTHTHLKPINTHILNATFLQHNIALRHIPVASCHSKYQNHIYIFPPSTAPLLTSTSSILIQIEGVSGDSTLQLYVCVCVIISLFDVHSDQRLAIGGNGRC